MALLERHKKEYDGLGIFLLGILHILACLYRNLVARLLAENQEHDHAALDAERILWTCLESGVWKAPAKLQFSILLRAL